MKADRSDANRLPEELLRELAREEPEDRQELEQVWQLLGTVRPSYDVNPPDAVAGWNRVSASLFSEDESTPARPDRRPARPPAERARLRRPVWAAVAATVCLLVGICLFSPVRYAASAGETLAVSLPDGSKAELNGGSVLTFDRGLGRGLFSRDETRRVHLEGEAFFTVVSDGRAFEVETFNARVQVLGTEFNVKSWPGSPAHDTRVAVRSGHVRVAPGDVDLLANQSVRIVSGERDEAIRMDDDLDIVLNWRQHGFSVLGEPLAAAFMQLERQYGVEIDLRTPIDPQLQIVYYRSEPHVETLLGDLCAAHGLKFRKTVRGYEVYR
ncbi:MAG: FecR domain-containing protein [Rhodothermales bacterium]